MRVAVTAALVLFLVACGGAPAPVTTSASTAAPSVAIGAWSMSFLDESELAMDDAGVFTVDGAVRGRLGATGALEQPDERMMREVEAMLGVAGERAVVRSRGLRGQQEVSFRGVYKDARVLGGHLRALGMRSAALPPGNSRRTGTGPGGSFFAGRQWPLRG